MKRHFFTNGAMNIHGILIATISILMAFHSIVTAQDGWYIQLSGTETLNDVHFVDVNTGWAVGNEGTILKTTDGGTTWNQLNSGTTKDCESVFFVNENVGWVTDAGWIMKTTDGGTTWSYQYKEAFSPLLFSVHFTDFNHGWVVGMNGFIMNTTDGGNIWTQQVSGSDAFLYSVLFLDSNTGWCIGVDYDRDKDVILHTSNGGSTWSSQISGFNLGLYAIYFVNSQIGWAMGGTDTLLKTSNGGETWNVLTTGLGWTYINSAFFSDQNIGWAVGDFGDIIYTTDGGTTWDYQESGTDTYLNSVYFMNESTGWIVGGNLFENNTGVILKTTTGGRTSVEEEGLKPIPRSYSLEQSYPNPFNSLTTITYSLPRTSHVTMTVYDLLGHRVTNLMNEVQDAGQHRVVWDASSSASGVYLYTIESVSTDGRHRFRAARKTMLLK